MDEKENRYATKLVNRMIRLSSLSVELEANEVEEALKDWETRESGLHVFIGKEGGDSSHPTEHMSMEEYKYHINKKIYAMPLHDSGKKASYTIQVTKEGLAKMKRDHQYEAYVLETIGTVLGQPVRSRFSDHFLLYFTDKKEENYGMGCGPVDDAVEYEAMEMGVACSEDPPPNKKRPGMTPDSDKAREKRKKESGEYYDLREGKRPRSRKLNVNPALIAKMHYAYNIAQK